VTSGVLYDFKRSFFRPSLIVLIVLFVAGGIGLAYLEISTAGLSSPQYYIIYGYEREMPYSASSNETMVGYLVNQYGQGMGGAKVYLESVALTTNATGYFTWERTPASFIPMGPVTFNYNGMNFTAQANFMAIVNVNLASHSGILILGAQPGLSIYLEQMKTYPNYVTNSKSSYENMTYLGVATSAIFRHAVDLNSTLPYASYAEVNTTTGLVVTGGSSSIPALMTQTNYSNELFTSGALFAEFFPIMTFYLVYAMFVSPRSAGALEFLLARPVTKAGIFASRYLGGALTLIISAIVAALALGLTISPLLREAPDYTDVGILAIALAVELITFYSLSFLVGVLVRRNGAYLGVSLALFVFFFMGIFGLITVLENAPYLYYLNPMGIYDMIANYARPSFYFGPMAAANLAELVVAVAAWIVLPSAVALFSYERQRVA